MVSTARNPAINLLNFCFIRYFLLILHFFTIEQEANLFPPSARCARRVQLAAKIPYAPVHIKRADTSFWLISALIVYSVFYYL
jgi:hypothetical protein